MAREFVLFAINTDLFVPSSDVRPTLIGSAIVRPIDNFAGPSEAEVISVILNKWQYVAWHTYQIPGAFSNFEQVEMA